MKTKRVTIGGATVLLLALTFISLHGVAQAQTAPASCFQFTHDLGVGSTLQGRESTALGALLNTAPVTTFDENTASLVVNYQRANNLLLTGYFGPATRSLANGSAWCTTLRPTINGVILPANPRANQEGQWSINATNPMSGNLHYVIYWGDGSRSDGTLNGPVTHTYTSAGSYTAMLAVDNGLMAAHYAQTIYVSGQVSTAPCPVGLACSPVGTNVSCPDGYSCTRTVTYNCPNGLTCYRLQLPSDPMPTVGSASVSMSHGGASEATADLSPDLKILKTLNISWTSNNVPASAPISIWMFSDDYQHAYDLTGNQATNAGTFTTVMPSNVVPGTYRVQVVCPECNVSRLPTTSWYSWSQPITVK